MNKKEMIRFEMEEQYVPEKIHYLWIKKIDLQTINKVHLFLNSIDNDFPIEYAALKAIAYFEEPNGDIYNSGSSIAVGYDKIYCNNIYGTTCILSIKDILKML